MLKLYFERIVQKSFGEANIVLDNTESDNYIVHKITDVLEPPLPQQIRDMRHHICYTDLGGFIEYYCQETSDTLKESVNVRNLLMTAYELVQRNRYEKVGNNSTMISNQQTSTTRYTYIHLPLLYAKKINETTQLSSGCTNYR